MRLGIGSYAYAWAAGAQGGGFGPPAAPLTAMGLIEKTLALGVGLVQICDNLPLETLDEPALDELQSAADRLGVQIEVGTRGIRPDPLMRCLELAKRFGSPLLRVVVDRGDDKPSLADVRRTIRPLLGVFAEADVVLAIENHDRFASKDLADLIERLDSPQVGICLDTVNSFGALEGPGEVLSALGPYVVSLHVKDFDIRRMSHNMGFVLEGRPAGQGRLNVPWLLRRIGEEGRDPNAILELWPPPQATLDETIALEDDWARRSVEYLRGLIAD